jgi:hypothetical protein
LNAIDCLIKVAVEEGILHIKLAKKLVAGESQRKRSLHGGRFDDEAEKVSAKSIPRHCVKPRRTQQAL